MSDGVRVLVAAALLNLCMGSLYAFSVLLAPLQEALGLDRAAASAAFSAATIVFTATMLVLPRAYGRIGAPALAAAACGTAAAGLALAALWPAYPALLLGYGLLFGIGSGIGYSVALQSVNLAMRRRRGLATGIVVASYGLGGILFAPLFRIGLAHLGPFGTMGAAAVLFAAAGVLAAALLAGSGVRLGEAAPARAGAAGPAGGGMVLGLMWGGFFLGAGAGLMAIGHAAGIVAWAGGGADAAALGTAAIAFGNTAGRLGAGWISDRVPVARVMAAVGLLSAAALVSMALTPTVPVALATLTLAGFGYGTLAGGYPAAIVGFFGPAAVGRMYGRIITAWGVAGLAGPWLAGFLFDRTGGYAAALLLAAAAALGAAAVNLLLARQPAAPLPGRAGVA